MAKRVKFTKAEQQASRVRSLEAEVVFYKAMIGEIKKQRDERRMTREEWERCASLVSDEMFDEPATVHECAWNMALRSASRVLMREAVRVGAQWTVSEPMRPAFDGANWKDADVALAKA